MSTGWMIFTIVILFVCTAMVTLLIIASCKDDVDDDKTDSIPEEILNKWLKSLEEDKDE